jgi:hypothetical protein
LGYNGGMQQRRVELLVLAIALAVISGTWLWWVQVRQNPNRVFWNMISNNLSTSGATHVTLQSAEGLSVLQYTQLSFTQHPTAHALTIFKQNGNTLAAEQISSQEQDFVRYQQVNVPAKSGAALDVRSVVGKWAQLQSGQTVNNHHQLQLKSGLFDQSVLEVLPIGNLSATARKQLIRAMHDQQLFAYDSKKVKKADIKGRSNYLYQVSIKPDAYVRIMQQFESLAGGTAYRSLKAADYAHNAPISVVISVDARSHELAQVYEVSAQRAEVFQGFGITADVPLPKADITAAELAQRLSQLQR